MKPERLVQHLSDAARKIGYRVRSEEGNFRGGSCVLSEERMVILNRRQSFEERAELLGRVLAGQNLDGVFLLPEVRKHIEKFIGDPAVTTAATVETETQTEMPAETESNPELPSEQASHDDDPEHPAPGADS